MREPYKYLPAVSLTKANNPHGSLNTTNPHCPDVKKAFRSIQPRGDYLTLYDGGDHIPPGRYTEAFSNDFRLTHFQGLQRLRLGKFLVVSGGDNIYKESHLFIVRMGSRKAVGAWRSNYLTGKLDLRDRVAGIVKIASGRWHAGGMSVSGDLLAVPVYSTGKTVDKISSAIRFFHMKDPLSPEALSVSILREGETAGAVAMVRIPTNGRLLVAVWSDADKNLPRRLDFYLSRSKDILDGFETVSKEWLASAVKANGSLEPNFSNFQNTNFIVEERNGQYKLFLVGTHNTKFLSLGEDFADLFEVSFEGDSVFDTQPTLSDVTVTRLAKKKFPNAHFQFHFAAAGGIYIDSSGGLRLYSSYYWKSDNVLKFAEFRPEVDVVAPDITDINHSWVEMFEHGNFKGRRLSARDIRQAEFSDYEHVYVEGGAFESGVSSLRYQIPQGNKYRLYEREDFKGRHIDLDGTGLVEEIDDLGDVDFQDRVSSSKSV